jgi:hypothetical protein
MVAAGFRILLASPSIVEKQATAAAFVTVAEGFSPAAGARRVIRQHHPSACGVRAMRNRSCNFAPPAIDDINTACCHGIMRPASDRARIKCGI